MMLNQRLINFEQDDESAMDWQIAEPGKRAQVGLPQSGLPLKGTLANLSCRSYRA